MKKQSHIFIIASLLVVQSYAIAQYKPAEVYYKNYPVSNNQTQDSSVLRMLSAYKDSVAKTMNKVIGFATVTLYEKQPESPLGNFFVDAMRVMAEKHFNRKIDAAVMNAGGIRSYIPKGDITIRKMYELMPFENLIVLQEMKGSVLKQFLDHAANAGGWPVSGITMQIKNRKAENIMIGGKLLDENATYVIAQSDYVANGGDNSAMLKNIPQISVGYLLRDALIEYVQQFTLNGKPVTATLENRVTHAD